MSWWKTEFRMVIYSWEYETVRSFYKNVLKLEQLYSWYASPVDKGCKVVIGPSRLELICRRPTTYQGAGGMRLQAKCIDDCYNALVGHPLVDVVFPITNTSRGERAFTIKDPIGNWVEVYQKNGNSSGAAINCEGYFTDEYTAIIYAADVDALLSTYRDRMKMECVEQYENGPNDRCYRLKAAGGFIELRSKTSQTPQGPVITTIEAVDVDALYREVSNAPDLELIWDLEDTWYGIRMFQVRDKEGNMTEAISYKRNIGFK